MNHPALVSVIVPVYNVERYVERCVNSILAQSYPHIEVILVNDGSTDNSLRVIEQYREDKRCRIVDRPNRGASSARNAGLAVAVGDFVYFIDSDDYIRQDAVELLLTRITQTDADFCCYRISFFNEQEQYKVHGEKFGVDILEGNDAVLTDALLCDRIKTTVWSKFWKRDFLEKHQLRFIEGINCEDTIFTIQSAVYARRVAFLDEVLYFALMRTTSISRDIKPQNITSYIRVYQVIRETLEKEGKFGRYRKYYEASYVKSILFILIFSAYRVSDYKIYRALFALLEDQPYVNNRKGGKNIRLTSERNLGLYLLSLKPRLFYNMIKLLKRMGLKLYQ